MKNLFIVILGMTLLVLAGVAVVISISYFLSDQIDLATYFGVVAIWGTITLDSILKSKTD